MQKRYKYKGFTLIEILLTIVLLGILLGIVLIAINPNKQFGQVRDLDRQDDITDIQQALVRYSGNNKGKYPTGLEVGTYREICGDVSNANCVNLSILVPYYLTSIPKDPNGNNYLVGINPYNNSISVWAQSAEQREVVINKFNFAKIASKDISFDTGIPEGFNNGVYTLAVQSDGKVLVGGAFTTYQGTLANYIIRLNSDGSRDNSFNIGTGFNGGVYTLAVQSDGKIIVGGFFTTYQGTSANYIVRLNSDGSRDNNFNIGTGFNNGVYKIAIQSDGKIVVSGLNIFTYQGFEANRIIRLNSDGSRDNSFNIGTGFNSAIYNLAIQSDGKIIVVGGFTTYQGVVANRIIRLNSDGSRDNSFNIGTGFDYYVDTIAIQSDGKILVGGWFSIYNGTTANRIIRLNSDGILDSTFNTGTLFNSNSSNSVNTIAIQSDGKIVIGGVNILTYQGVLNNYITRLNTNGTLDNSFNIGTGFNGGVYNLAIQSDGKILVGGYFTTYQGTSVNRMIRLNSEGSRDTNIFQSPSNTGFSGSYTRLNNLAIQSDGKVLVGGAFTSYKGTVSNYIVRVNSDGSRDNSFNIGTGFNNGVYTLAIQSDGKIVVGGGFTSYQGVSANNIIRLNSDGTRDNSFNLGTGFNNYVYTLAIQSDGKILVGGFFTTSQGTSANRIIRLNSDGSIDNSFNLGTGFNGGVYNLAIQSDGKILVVGEFTSYNGTVANYIIRLNSDGSRDNSFNIGTGFNNLVYTLAIQSDGKIIVGGYYFNTYQGVSANNIIRLNSDGSRDNSFNIGTGFNNGVYTLAIQSDGKVLVGGRFTTYQGTSANRMIRLNSDGSRDTIFDIGTGFNDGVNTLAIQSDGNIVAVGDFTIYQDQPTGYLIRLYK